MPKMVKTELVERVYGYAAYAMCPICGADVHLGGHVNIDEAPSEIPVDELVEICVREVVHTKKQAVSHAKAEWAYEYGAIVPDDYVQ